MRRDRSEDPTKSTSPTRPKRGRILYTFNVGDFMRLHGEYVTTGRAHAGIIFGDQQRFGVGEQTRRLLRIIALRSAEE